MSYQPTDYVEFDSSTLIRPATLAFGSNGSLSGVIPVNSTNRVTGSPPTASAPQLTPDATLTFNLGAVAGAIAAVPKSLAYGGVATGPGYAYAAGGSLTLSGSTIGNTNLALGAGTLLEAADQPGLYFLLVSDGSGVIPSSEVGAVSGFGEFLVCFTTASGTPDLSYAALVLNIAG